MMTTVEGVVRGGKVEFAEAAEAVEGSRVDFPSLGITKEQAAEIRCRFGRIAEDWERPEMDVYDEL